MKFTKRDIYTIVSKIAFIDMQKVDAGNRYELNKLEATALEANAFLEKLQFGDYEAPSKPTRQKDGK